MSRLRRLFAILLVPALFLSTSALAEARVEFFSPTGTVKNVRQVLVRFSAPMVPFGDPRLAEPFDIQCPQSGKARWADTRNWVYDFDRDLPGGVACTFRLKDEVTTLTGEVVAGSREFTFNTGGPAIRQSMPQEGSSVDEEQIFILGLDAPADTASVVANAWCEVQGVQEKVGVRLVGEDERRQLFEHQRDLFDRMVRALVVRKTDGAVVGALDTRDLLKGSDLEQLVTHPGGTPIVVLACQRRLPNDAQVRLVWGKGIRTVSGIATEKDQTRAWRVRPRFEARFHCERVNEDAQCMPIAAMSLHFSSPVPRALADRVELRGADGKRYLARQPGDEQRDQPVSHISWDGPLPEKTGFTIVLPPEFRDDAGRALANAASFPLQVATDEFPPLAKFPASFGIIELNADATLPVTVRNVEAPLNMSSQRIATEVAPPQTTVTSGVKNAWNTLFKDEEEIAGSVVRLGGAEEEVIAWLRRLNAVDRHGEGTESIFAGGGTAPQHFALPRPRGEREFEVLGIPFKTAGLYIVELASPRLGDALLRDPENKDWKPQPYYVKTAALVTNLSVHFKRGRESSLVWVTTLDKGQPAAGAKVAVRDCGGSVYWEGVADANGLVRVNKALPEERVLPGCRSEYDKQYFVTARMNGDFSFVLSEWDQGIEAWRFHLPSGSYDGPYVASTVFDRTLLRAGETVHMTHYYRQHTGNGFTFPPKERLPRRVTIEHLGSDQKYVLKLAWDGSGIAESEWAIPQDAKLGTYSVTLGYADYASAQGNLPERTSGNFQVQAFRVPALKAVLKPLQAPLVNAREAVIDAQLNYFSGGPAGGAAVKVRGMVQPLAPSYPEYEGFLFGNGNVAEGRSEDNQGARWYYGDYELGEMEEGEDGGGDSGDEPATPRADGVKMLAVQNLTLNEAGAARVTLEGLPRAETPQLVRAEMEYSDPNGEVLSSSTRIPLWPANVLLGLRPDAWAATKDKVRVHALALGLDGRPRAGVAVKLDLLQRITYSHRKRLVGGFYAYESRHEVKRVGDGCEGRTDAKGLLICEFKSPVDGNLIVRGKATDEAGNASFANHDVWVTGNDDWWFDVSNDDRMDLLPEKRSYRPNETAVFQARMPFREATALVTVEREGVLEAFVTRLSGKGPVVRVPLRGNYAPNVFVSVLAVRGRAAGVQPTALIDLGKPAYKLGIAEVKVGWDAHRLKVDVAPERQVYRVRDKSAVKVKVTYPDGKPAANAEMAFAAVDEGLLELKPNDSWKLLDAMMAQRGIEVRTSTAQMHVVGRRHYGRKALPAGGGGGRMTSRELFDTLLLWQGRVRLDGKGEAVVLVPINDSLSSFRLVAVASAGAGFFGTGAATIRTTQDLMLLPGLPPQVREQDRYRAGVTVRNASTRVMEATVAGGWRAVETFAGARIPVQPLSPQKVMLQPGQAATLAWDVVAPINGRRLEWQFTASAPGVQDSVKVMQQEIPAVAVRTFQASLMQLDKTLALPVAMPADAIPGRGGIRLHLRARLADELSGVKEYMGDYPYTCLEQRISQAVALQDEGRWDRIMATLPAYLDSDGLVKYFPLMRQGSDTLTAYLLAIAEEAGWEIPESSRQRMLRGMKGFVEGRVVRYSSLPTADLTLRKLAALNAIARHEGGIGQSLLGSVSIDPNLWPTSAVIDWIDILDRSEQLADRERQREDAVQVLRSRLNFQGTTMGFSTERADALWWLMCSADTNANRALLTLLKDDEWREDLPRMVRGSVGRQHRGHWNTTVANAWGTLALAKFAEKFEAEPVKGATTASLGGVTRSQDWNAQAAGGTLSLDWPAKPEPLQVSHAGGGKPWVTVQSLAAIPLRQPFSSGYAIARTVTPVDQKTKGVWSRGDVYRVRLELEAQADMTWVVVRDPIPSGATILGTGLGNDSQILTQGEKRQGWVWPAFEERTHESFRAYYDFVPKGKWVVEYTVRLNNAGRFLLPETRVEAMYSPEAFAEIPNEAIDVK
jgi:uncharacterized protein YfaS (alpha-2-macroglobulin family)